VPAAFSRARAAASGWWQAQRRRHAWLDHTATAYGHYQGENGDQMAAAITYFSFLAMFPLILLAVSVTGFVLAASPHLQAELLRNISAQVPGSFGTTVKNAVDAAVRQRTAVGIVGLAGVALTGLGWIDNLRTAIDTIWGRTVPGQSFLAKKAGDALVLVGLGLGAIVSLAVTAGGTAASHQVLGLIHAGGVPGASALAAVLALLLAVLGSVLIFGWLLIRLPAAPVSRRTAFKASLLAAVGFEVLKVFGTYYIARVTRSPATAIIGPALGILVWLNLVARYLLFCVAWAATARDAERLPDPLEQPVEGPPVPPAAVPVLSPVGVAAALFSAGATAGAGAFAYLQGRRSRATGRPPQPPRSGSGWSSRRSRGRRSTPEPRP
jgi:membrane protein